MKKVNHVKNILDSFEKLTGKIIITRMNPEADLLEIENADFALVAHGTEEDPILNFGNQFALKLWEMKWDDFVKTTSKTTAETDLRENRSEILKIVSKQGYYDNYQGVRISSKGNRFKIKNAVIWNVNDENGNLIGQAAYFKTVQFIK